MAIRERPADRGRRRARRMLDEAVAEFRLARVERGISQQQVAVAIGRSEAWVSWTEAGGNRSLSVVDLFAMLACVDREGLASVLSQRRWAAR